jgi:hypothetical protein
VPVRLCSGQWVLVVVFEQQACLELAAGVLGVLASLAQLMVGLLEQLLEQLQVLALPM